MSHDEKNEILIDFIKSNQILKHIILLGDFNIDFKSNIGENFIRNIFNKFKLIKIPNQYTTKKYTEIDAIYCNCGLQDYFVYYTTYSHHFSKMAKI